MGSEGERASEEAALAGFGFAAPEFARPGFAHAEHFQRLVEFEVVFREDALSDGLQQGGAVEPGILDGRIDGVGVERTVGDGTQQSGGLGERSRVDTIPAGHGLVEPQLVTNVNHQRNHFAGLVAHQPLGVLLHALLVVVAHGRSPVVSVSAPR